MFATARPVSNRLATPLHPVVQLHQAVREDLIRQQLKRNGLDPWLNQRYSLSDLRPLIHPCLLPPNHTSRL
jgi:hypothetical protein